MRVARSLDEAAQFGPTAVAIGNFDGVHIAHRELLSAVLRASREHALAPSILTFDPHPASVVAPQRVPRLLSTLAERCTLLAREAGTAFSGVPCGRATWKDGIPIYATKGLKALEDFLSTKGVENINAVNAALKGATPWFKKLGIAA